MLVKGKNVVGLNIVTVDTGAIVETVDDIAYNPTTQRVEALLVSSGGLFSSAKAVAMDDVRNIGEDAVIIPTESVITSVKDLGDSIHSISDSNKHLVKTNVLTIDGKELGRVTDIYFDSVTGVVETMEVSQGGLKTMTEGKKSIKPGDIVTIGADATIVSNYTEMLLEEQGEEGGLKGALNTAGDKLSQIAEDTKEKAQEATEVVKQKSVELRDASQEKFEETREYVQEKSADAKVVIDEKSREARVRASEIQDDLRDKTSELNDNMSDKTQEVQTVIKKEVKNVQDKHGDKISAATDTGRKVVEQTKKKYQDAEQEITLQKTKITDK